MSRLIKASSADITWHSCVDFHEKSISNLNGRINESQKMFSKAATKRAPSYSSSDVAKLTTNEKIKGKKVSICTRLCARFLLTFAVHNLLSRRKSTQSYIEWGLKHPKCDKRSWAFTCYESKIDAQTPLWQQALFGQQMAQQNIIYLSIPVGPETPSVRHVYAGGNGSSG